MESISLNIFLIYKKCYSQLLDFLDIRVKVSISWIVPYKINTFIILFIYFYISLGAFLHRLAYRFKRSIINYLKSANQKKAG